MHAALSLARLITAAAALFVMTLVILIAALLPFTHRDIPIAAWMATSLARFYLRLFDVHITYHHPQRLDGHSGFIFPNHVSFLDILVMLHRFPVRFLSKAELSKWPLIGLNARAIGTVFVNRGDKSSREAAREALSQANTFPPIVLFPEGGIFPPADRLKPFRYGAFEIAHHGQVPYLPCVLLYKPLDVAFWGNETVFSTAWQFAGKRVPVHVDVHFLRRVTPQPDDDPHELALETHGAMNAVLRHGGHQEDLLQSGL